MAIARKIALQRLRKYRLRVEELLHKIRDHPGHSSQDHWRHEVRVWLGIMESMVQHVGKKTSTEWGSSIEEFREQLTTEPQD